MPRTQFFFTLRAHALTLWIIRFARRFVHGRRETIFALRFVLSRRETIFALRFVPSRRETMGTNLSANLVVHNSRVCALRGKIYFTECHRNLAASDDRDVWALWGVPIQTEKSCS